MLNNNSFHFLKKFQPHYFDVKIFFYVFHLFHYNKKNKIENLFLLFQKYHYYFFVFLHYLYFYYFFYLFHLYGQTFVNIYIDPKEYYYNYPQPKKF